MADATVARLRLDVPDAALDDLRARLRATRWPERETVDDDSQGVPLADLQALCAYWADGYDWRATEARLNAAGQFHTTIDGLDIHFLHVRSPHPGALALILTHGWPGGVVEFLKVIEPLTGDTEHPFDLVIPSLPGYGFSAKPASTGWDVHRIARAWVALMTRLGYDRFGAAGSDWGTSISASIGAQAPERVAGIHLVPPLAAPDPVTLDDLTAAERRALEDLERAATDGGAYGDLHATRPQTIGYGLVDSPAFLAAWIVEKLRAWADGADALTRDEMLDLVMLYWLPATGASAARLYWESYDEVGAILTGPDPDPIDVPTGATVFPRENPRPSRRWAARRFPDLRHWGEPARGGHFGAYEQPGAFVAELRAFFATVR